MLNSKTKLFLQLILITASTLILTSCNINSTQEKTSNVKVKSFELNGENELVEIELGKAKSVSYFALPYEIERENITCISENENIAQAVLDTVNGVNGRVAVNVQIRSKGIGKTKIYIKDSNGNLESEKVSVSVVKSFKNNYTDDSDIVYLTPTGRKYHLSKSCGGTNSYKSTLNRANSLGKEPCSKCAQ